MSNAPRSPDAPDPLIGRVLAGHYRVDARIGGGAMGTVYRAHHTLLEQDFAVKVLAQGLAHDPDVRRRFLVEARSLASFVHKHAVSVRECGEDQGLLYLAMDLVPGETLAALLARDGLLAPARAVEIAIQILEALGEAHLAGIVHRDLKPGNVMIQTKPSPAGPVDTVRVVDFGLARIVGAERSALPDAFASIGGNVVGTVAYMSPEQLRADEGVDGRSDLFSVGVVLHELLTGASPFPGTSTMSIAMRIVDAEPDPLPPAIALEVGAPLESVLLRSLAKRPEDRFATAGEMASALRDALAGSAPVTSRPRASASVARPVADAGPVVETSAVRAPPGRRRLAAYVVAAAGVAMVATVVFLLVHSTREGAARARAIELSHEGRYAEAVTAWSDVIDRQPRDGVAFLSRAMARTELSDRNAPADLDEAERLLPGDARVQVARGRWLWRVEKDWKHAEAAFVKALTLDSASADARVERALAELDRGDAPLAERDADALEKLDAKDARVPWLRSLARSALAQAATTSAAARPLFDDAVAFGRAAVAADPRSADAAAALSSAFAARAYAEKTRGEYDASRATLAEAIAAATLAIERATANPAYRGQGATRAARFLGRAGVFNQTEDHRSALRDLDAALELSPKDPDLLATRAFALQQSGDHEGAIRDYARLYDVTNEPDHLFRQGFGWQRIGDGRELVGDGAGAIEAYDKAIELYGVGIARAPDRPDFSAYRGETRTHRARWLPVAERDAAFAEALPDFDRALAVKTADAETLLRRCEHHLARGDPASALADVRAAIGDRKDRTPRYYARRAKAAMLVSRDTLAKGDGPAARSLAAEAVENAIRARDLSPEEPRALVPLVAEAYVRAAAAAQPPERAAFLAEADTALTALAAAVREGDEDAVRTRATIAHVRAGMALVAGDRAAALALAREATETRAAEAKARRWYEDAGFVERLAEALEANGDHEAAATARARATTLPR